MVRRLSALLPLASLLLFGAPQKRKQSPAVLDVTEFKVRRDGDRLNIDGKLKNTGQHAINRGELVLNFLSTDRKVVSTRRSEIEPELLEPGGEALIMLETPFPVGAVAVQLEAKDREGRSITVEHRGPYPIE